MDTVLGSLIKQRDYWERTTEGLREQLARVQEIAQERGAECDRLTQELDDMRRLILTDMYAKPEPRPIHDTACYVGKCSLEWWAAQDKQESHSADMQEAPDEMLLGEANEYEYIRDTSNSYLWHDRKQFCIYLNGYGLYKRGEARPVVEDKPEPKPEPKPAPSFRERTAIALERIADKLDDHLFVSIDTA